MNRLIIASMTLDSSSFRLTGFRGKNNTQKHVNVNTFINRGKYKNQFSKMRHKYHFLTAKDLFDKKLTFILHLKYFKKQLSVIALTICKRYHT